MKSVYKVIFVSTLILSTFTHANQFYLGTDFSRMTLDQSEFESANVNSVLAGYTFKNWGIEGSYNVSDTHNEFYGGDQKINMYHLYGVYRSQGDFYYKAKLGLTNERYKFYDSNKDLTLDDVHTGIARGLGIGYRYKQLSFELEYNWLGGSLEMLGVGVRYNFK